MSFMAEALARARQRAEMQEQTARYAARMIGAEVDHEKLRNASTSRFAKVLEELAKGPKGTDFIDALVEANISGRQYYLDIVPEGGKVDPQEVERSGIRAMLRKMGLPTDE